MKLSQHDNTLKTNVNFERQEFGIGNANKIIEILRNRLYKNPIRVLTQEYICNARDANREIKSKKPIEITMPNKLNPVFKVRDFGPGLTPDRVANVFIMYGSSTKTDSNDQTGGFGIGAKSAWSYTDSFTVISWVDGTKRTYVAHIGVNNNGSLDLIDTEKTSELNGVEIHVAVKPNDLGEFENSILRTVYFWDKSEKPIFKGILDADKFTRRPGLVLDDNLEIVAHSDIPYYINSGYNDSLAVVDGIPYDLGYSFTEKSDDLQSLVNLIKHRVVIHVGNGVFEVSADREGIADREITIKSLDDICSRLLGKTTKYIHNKFKTVKSINSYIETYIELDKVFEVDGNSEYKGYTIEHNSIKNDILENIDSSKVFTSAYNITDRTKVIRKDHGTYVDLKKFDRLYYLDIEESKLKQNRRIRNYFTLINKDLYIFEPKKGHKKAFNKLKRDFKLKPISSLEYTEPEKVERVKAERGKTEFCIRAFISYKSTLYITLDSNTQKWLYVPMEKGMWPAHRRYEYGELDKYLKDNTDYRVCGLSKRALNLVKKDSNFKPLEDLLKTFKIKKEHISSYKNSKRKNNSLMETVKQIKKIDDKFLRSMVKEYGALDVVKKIKLPHMLKDKLVELNECKQFVANDIKLQLLFEKKYPLVEMITDYHVTDKVISELEIYINAKHRSKK